MHEPDAASESERGADQARGRSLKWTSGARVIKMRFVRSFVTEQDEVCDWSSLDQQICDRYSCMGMGMGMGYSRGGVALLGPAYADRREQKGLHLTYVLYINKPINQ